MGVQCLSDCQDSDPYVRKTAVLAVAKFYDLSPTVCEQNGFLEALEDMLSDSNPMVRAQPRLRRRSRPQTC